MDNRRLVSVRSTLVMALTAGTMAVFPSFLPAQVDTHAFGAGVQLQNYSFGEALGTDAATLLMIPAGYTLPLGDRVRLDLHGAYARGTVEAAGRTYTLQGPVDTRIRGTLNLTPWAALTAGVNLPTGNATHDADEAVVASVLATDILGFQEATWGTGTGVTTGLATAYPVGEWGVGLGASYRLSGSFEPREDQSLTYEPGDEIRVRFALDRNVGEGGKFTAGITFQNYSEDTFGDRNLFQAGNRVRGDVSYAFRTGRSTWALYAMNVWREAGDRFLYYEGNSGTAPDSTVVVGSQNLLLLGLNGSAPLGAALRIRPSLDFRYQTRDAEEGEGWIVGAGADLPLRLSDSYDAFPRARFSWGQLKAVTGETESLWGVEVGLTFRWRVQ